MKRVLFVLFVLALALAACQEARGPADTIHMYLRIKVEQSDADALAPLACADWEQQLVAEAATFQDIDSQIETLSCEPAGAEGAYTLVACEGKVKLTYGGGDTEERDIGGLYRAIEEGGEWKMCGLAEGG